MDIHESLEKLRKRSELKSYFIKNAIPTQSHFEEFINAVLNQKDDGIAKTKETPLCIEALGDKKTQQKVLNFYRSFNEKKPSWVINLNLPSSVPGKSARPCFNISDGEDQTRLFIDGSNGHVGIGTTEPSEALEVSGRVKATAIALDNLPIQTTDSSLLLGRILVRQHDFADRHNYGLTWTSREDPRNWRSVALSADGRVQTAVVSGGQIYVSTNSGATWTPQEEDRDWYSVALSADGRIQTAVVYEGQIYVSTDSGANWTAGKKDKDGNLVDLSANWRSVALSANGRIQTAVVDEGQIYVSTDSGATWTAGKKDKDGNLVDLSANWRSVALSADGRIQTAVVDEGQIYVSTDSGATWTAGKEDKDGNLVDLSANWLSVALSADGRIQTAVVYEGQIYVSTDSGATWIARADGLYWTSVALSADGRIQTAVVSGGQIYVSTDSGATWTPQGEDSDWYSVALSADGRIQTAVVYEGQIYVSTDSGATWTPGKEDIQGNLVDLSGSWQGVALSADGTKQTAVVNGGYIFVSSADVILWSNVGIGTTEPGVDSLDVRGSGYISGGWKTTKADYAELFEADGDSVIPPGTSVSVILTKNEKVKIIPCEQTETPIGVISANPAIIGNSYKEWPKKYERDVFGNVKMVKKKEKVMAPTRPGDPDYPKPKETGDVITRRSPKLNPKYDPKKEYKSREQRKEWHCVGLLGQLTVLKGQPTAPTWVKLKDISDKYERWLVK